MIVQRVASDPRVLRTVSSAQDDGYSVETLWEYYVHIVMAAVLLITGTWSDGFPRCE